MTIGMNEEVERQSHWRIELFTNGGTVAARARAVGASPHAEFEALIEGIVIGYTIAAMRGERHLERARAGPGRAPGRPLDRSRPYVAGLNEVRRRSATAPNSPSAAVSLER